MSNARKIATSEIRTFFLQPRRIMIVFTLSFMLSGMSALLIASNGHRRNPDGAARVMPAFGGEAALAPCKQQALNSPLEGAMRAARFIAPSQAPRKAFQLASTIKPEAKVVVAHNVGYDSISNGITSGSGYEYSPTIFISEGETVNFYGPHTAVANTWAICRARTICSDRRSQSPPRGGCLWSRRQPALAPL